MINNANQGTMHMNDVVLELSPEERDRIVRSIFSPESQPEGYFLYLGDEAKRLYKKMTHDAEYFPYQTGIDLLMDNREELWQYVERNVIDFGSGTGEKTSKFLEGINKSVNYIPYDYSNEAMNAARETVGKNPHVCATSEGVILKGESTDLTILKSLSPKTVLFLGGTTANLSHHENVRKLQEFKNTSRCKRDWILRDYYPAPTEKEIEHLILPAYDNESTKEWLQNGLKTLRLDASNISLIVRYVKNPPEGILENGVRVFPGEIRGEIVVEKNTEIILDNGEVFSVEAGTYPLNISRRRSEKEVKQIFKQAGVKLERIVYKPGMNAAVLKIPPTKLAYNSHRISYVLLTVLLLTV